MPRPTITRQQFTDAIEAAIDCTILPASDADALRAVARDATEFTVGTFKSCPLTQAGLYPCSPARPRSFSGLLDLGSFAEAFDEIIRCCVKWDGIFEVGVVDD